MIGFKGNSSINDLLYRISRLEVQFKIAQGRAPALFLSHLHTLGKQGVIRIEKIIRDDVDSPLLGSGWTYEIGNGYIKWFHTMGTGIVNPDTNITVNHIIHFLDEGTAAHGPVTAQYMHFYGRKQWAGQEFFLRWVSGIRPRNYISQLREYILGLHRSLMPSLLKELYRGIT